MKRTLPLFVAVAALAVLPALQSLFAEAEQPATAFPTFKMQELDKGLDIGYAVILVDLNGDGKKDIVVVDKTRVVWYENPSWKKRLIIDNQTKPDNVCIDAYDIDGDGQLDLALGADWNPSNTKSGGTLQWLKRGKTLDDKWSVYPIDTEPTVHRIRFADVFGTGKSALVLAPLQGRETSAKNNWMDGKPVRIIAYKIPANPTKDRWPSEVLDESLRVVHNLHPIPRAGGKGMDILTASYEGVHLLAQLDGKWNARKLGEGNQANPKSNRGSSEIKMGKLKSGKSVIATIEPWHGNQVVVYSEPSKSGDLWTRHVIDDKLKWGHAVSFADLDGDGGDELVIGVRDDLSQQQGERRGVRVYKALDEQGAKWARHIVENGGMAAEDMTTADLNGDGRMDIVAVGRQTKNLRVYWNEGVK